MAPPYIFRILRILHNRPAHGKLWAVVHATHKGSNFNEWHTGPLPGRSTRATVLTPERRIASKSQHVPPIKGFLSQVDDSLDNEIPSCRLAAHSYV